MCVCGGRGGGVGGGGERVIKVHWVGVAERGQGGQATGLGSRATGLGGEGGGGAQARTRALAGGR